MKSSTFAVFVGIVGAMVSLTLHGEDGPGATERESGAKSVSTKNGEIVGYINCSDLPENRLKIWLVLLNKGAVAVRLPTARKGGADELVQRSIRGAECHIVNLWGTQYGQAGEHGLIPLKMPACHSAAVQLKQGEATLTEAISVDLVALHSKGVTTLVYQYVVNPLGDNPQGFWSGKVTAKINLLPLMQRRAIAREKVSVRTN